MERIFGITGGVGMGKSTLGDLLARRGVALVDTDAIARHIVEPGQPALGEIVQYFGVSILRPDGSLNREDMARRIFSDDQARAELESILHPRIRAIWTGVVEGWRNGRSAQVTGTEFPPTHFSPQTVFGAVIIPLLFETNAGALFDATICVACSISTQSQRLRERGWDPGQIERRIRAQWPVEKKIAQSDYVIWTDTPLHAVGSQLDRILKAKPVNTTV